MVDASNNHPENGVELALIGQSAFFHADGSPRKSPRKSRRKESGGLGDTSRRNFAFNMNLTNSMDMN